MSKVKLPFDVRIIPLNDLLLHEEVRNARVRELTEEMGEEGVLKDPITATRLRDRYLVLDGTHRCKALKALSCNYIVAQVVDYNGPKVKVGTWYHAFLKDDADFLRQEIRRLKDRLKEGGS